MSVRQQRLHRWDDWPLVDSERGRDDSKRCEGGRSGRDNRRQSRILFGSVKWVSPQIGSSLRRNSRFADSL
jgi:hypothetical protein